MSNKLCKLVSEGIIDIAIINDIFDNTDASAELDYSFLCFEDVYFGARKMIKERSEFPMSDWIIVDIGCAYAFSAFIFKDAKAYLGVDLHHDYYQASKYIKNGWFFQMDGELFIKEMLPKLDYDINKVMIICSYIPKFSNSQQCKYITDHFPNYMIEYTSYRKYRIRLNGGKEEFSN